MWDGEAFGQEIVRTVVAAIERATAPLVARNIELEARLARLEGRHPEKGEPGAPGQPGKDADPEVIRAMVADAVAALPPAKDGEPGRDGAPGERGEPGQPGRDADMEAIRAMVADAVAALPPAKDGDPGRDGAPGEKGEPGQPGRDADPEAIRAMVAEAVAALPPAKDGEPGRDGAPGEKGEKGDAGEKGDRGEPGLDGAPAPVVAGAIKDHTGELVLTLTDGTVLRSGIFDGAPGKDGADGLSVEDLAAELLEDGRTVRLSFVRGEVCKSFDVRFDIPIYRGVWREGEYQKSDEVTFGGSIFVAQEKTTSKPETDGTWKLAVKRGRDGRDAKPPAAPMGPIELGGPSK